MNARDWAEFLQSRIRKGSRHTVMLWGPPGIWKTVATKEATAAVTCPDCGKHPTYIVVEHLAQMDPVDVRGLLMYNPAKDNVAWHPNPKWMIGSKCRVCYLLDEFNQCERQTQKSALEFTNNHAMGGTPLPANSVMILAGNRVEDGADVEELIRPQRSRVTHIQAEFDPEVWLEWGIKRGIHPYIMSFHNVSKGSKIYKPDPNAQYGEPLPRTWEKVHDILEDDPQKFHRELVLGTIGEGMGTEFMAWVDVGMKLQPLIEEVLKGKDVEAKELSTQFFVSSAVVDRFRTEKTRGKLAERICNYAIFLKGSNPEAAVCMLKDAAMVDRVEMRKAPSWTKAADLLSDYTT